MASRYCSSQDIVERIEDRQRTQEKLHVDNMADISSGSPKPFFYEETQRHFSDGLIALTMGFRTKNDSKSGLHHEVYNSSFVAEFVNLTPLNEDVGPKLSNATTQTKLNFALVFDRAWFDKLNSGWNMEELWDDYDSTHNYLMDFLTNIAFCNHRLWLIDIKVDLDDVNVQPSMLSKTFIYRSFK
ncbi:hypothetical protein TgHK011_003752 [Trichoderma gracile]|nr:hypothetical protein TgHK011_003752 [Trichoderma gracile]